MLINYLVKKAKFDAVEPIVDNWSILMKSSILFIDFSSAAWPKVLKHHFYGDCVITIT